MNPIFTLLILMLQAVYRVKNLMLRDCLANCNNTFSDCYYMAMIL